MSTPHIKSPTKKAFYFPTSAEKADASPRKQSAKAKACAGRKKSASAAQAKVKSSKVSGKPAVAPVVEKAPRQKREKAVRDSFTMPKSDYARIAEIKQRCLSAGVQIKKGEVLRAGLQILAASSAEQLMAAVSAVEAVKTGRRAKA
jgi:hypothetical protein